MTIGHTAFVLFVILLAGWLLLRPKEQEMRVEMTPAAACDPIDHRSPGYKHPWEPVTDRQRDPRAVA